MTGATPSHQPAHVLPQNSSAAGVTIEPEAALATPVVPRGPPPRVDAMSIADAAVPSAPSEGPGATSAPASEEEEDDDDFDDAAALAALAAFESAGCVVAAPPRSASSSLQLVSAPPFLPAGAAAAAALPVAALMTPLAGVKRGFGEVDVHVSVAQDGASSDGQKRARELPPVAGHASSSTVPVKTSQPLAAGDAHSGGIVGGLKRSASVVRSFEV
jgi:hypothetical protein